MDNLAQLKAVANRIDEHTRFVYFPSWKADDPGTYSLMDENGFSMIENVKVETVKKLHRDGMLIKHTTALYGDLYFSTAGLLMIKSYVSRLY